MPLSELNTDDFVTYSQELREAKDPYTARKVQKDRHKHMHWLNTVTEEREILLTYEDADEIVTCVATRKNIEGYEWPDVPLVEEIVHGETVLEDQYLRFLSMPDRTPFTVHVDKIKSWTIARDEKINELDKKYKATMYV